MFALKITEDKKEQLTKSNIVIFSYELGNSLVDCIDISYQSEYPQFEVVQVRQNYSYLSELPLHIQDCILWLDASDLSTIQAYNNSVSSWYDKSDQKNNATQLVTSNQPLINQVFVNDNNTLNFNGTSHFMTLSKDINFINSTIFFALRIDGTGVQQLFSHQSNKQIRVSHANPQVAAIGNNWLPNYASGDAVSNFKIPLNTNIILGYSGGENLIFYYNNNSQIFSRKRVNTNTFPLNTLGRFWGVNYLKGLVCEIIVYNKILNSTEVSIINRYLATKWNIQLT